MRLNRCSGLICVHLLIVVQYRLANVLHESIKHSYFQTASRKLNMEFTGSMIGAVFV